MPNNKKGNIVPVEEDIAFWSLVFKNPIKQLLIFHLSCGDSETDAGDLLVCGAELDSVRFKERQENVHSDTFIPIHESVI